MEIDYVRIFSELASDVDLDPFTLKYCINRIKSEGFKFLSVTLPQLSKAVLHSLELGYFERPTSIAWKGKSLRYFSKFLNVIFDRNGLVVEDFDPTALWQLRQICEYFYKLAVPFDEEVLDTAEDDFIKVDSALASVPIDRDWVDQLRKDFETHHKLSSRASVSDIMSRSKPRPGSGTYADYHSWTNKFGLEWFMRKEVTPTINVEYKPYNGFFRPYKGAPVPEVYTGDTDFSEVLFVPKDSRGPRTIVREPFNRLCGQMAFNSYLATSINRSSHGRINFDDQSVNKKLAESSSVDRKYATIDLKNASDSVDSNIIRHIFRHSSGLLWFVNQRSKACTLPRSKRLYSLNKLAGMGSGLTFPCMSLLIHLTITRAFVNHLGCTYEFAKRLVYVYGDDIIIPTHLYGVATRALTRVKLNVNADKSFFRSHFRESCGGDYYNGQEVNPVRIKLASSNPKICGFKIRFDRTAGIVQLERHCRELVKNGMLSTAELYYSLIEKFVGSLPKVSGESPVLGRYSIMTPKYAETISGMYEEIRCIIPAAKKIVADIDPFVFLGRFFSRNNEKNSLSWLHGDNISGSHYGTVSVPYRIQLRRHRVSAFRCMS